MLQGEGNHMGKGLGLEVGREGAQPAGGRGVSVGRATVQDFGLNPEDVEGPAPEPPLLHPKVRSQSPHVPGKAQGGIQQVQLQQQQQEQVRLLHYPGEAGSGNSSTLRTQVSGRGLQGAALPLGRGSQTQHQCHWVSSRADPGPQSQ